MTGESQAKQRCGEDVGKIENCAEARKAYWARRRGKSVEIGD